MAVFYHQKIAKYARTKISETFAQKNRIILSVLDHVCDVLPTHESYALLQIPLEVNNFFEEMRGMYLIEYLAKNKRSADIRNFEKWWATVCVVIKDFFVAWEIIAEPLYDICKGRAANVLVKGNLRAALPDKYVRLLTPMPLWLADEKVATKLFADIVGDYDNVISVCRATRIEILAAYQGRITAAASGVVSNATSTRRERCVFENRCATWQVNNYYVLDGKSRYALYGDHRGLPKEMALLTASTLLPFYYLLVSEHLEITPSWLLNFKLYDKEGNLYGLQDNGRRAVSVKGRARREQAIVLTPFAQQLFQEILMLTKQAREYMQAKDNDDYRYLLIAADRVSEPARVQLIAPINSLIYRSSKFYKNLMKEFSENHQDTSMIKRITLSSVRKTGALKVYLLTGRVHMMSAALGHAKYKKDLLKQYLPEQIRMFFMHRWVRIYQTALTFEAVRGRDCMLEALSLSSMEEADVFFKNHGLKPLPKFLRVGTYGLPDSFETQQESTEKIIVPISTEVCTVLITMSHVVDKLRAGGLTITEDAETWYQTAKFIDISIGLSSEGKIDGISDEASKIFREAKYSHQLGSKFEAFLSQ
ncbi:hypothetical protein [Pseudomonas sp. GM80]|uniref:hypothetical protein n=1 Tax=Pseudomonas sp. GM80 TaxID=1144339 RepID=UPI0012F6AF49|nr:hypothetical protein [Pseudomonas sp. GM80]